MKCEDARDRMLAARRGHDDDDLASHLETCAACRTTDAADAALDRALSLLPNAPAPVALRHDLEARIRRASGATATAKQPSSRANARVGLTALGVIAIAAVVLLFMWPRARGDDPMIAEAVNDHLRVLYAEPRVEIASGGIHQVKPWFAGRLDFAPVMPFAGDDDFPLEGGSVAYFVDRKAAAFVFKRRLHVITVFVFRADGLAWPAPTEAIGRVRATVSSSRGFHAVLFRDGDLGYAVVSDVDTQDLRALALRIVGP